MRKPVFDSGRDGQTVNINPSWLIQTLVLVIIGVGGYFMDGSLQDIKSELTLGRLERAQLRADLSATQVGLTGDRFTRTDWTHESDRISEALTALQTRVRILETKK